MSCFTRIQLQLHKETALINSITTQIKQPSQYPNLVKSVKRRYGFAKIDRNLLSSDKLKPTEKQVLTYLLDCRSDFLPTITTIAKYVALSARTIMRSIRKLELAGFISVLRRIGRKNRYLFKNPESSDNLSLVETQADKTLLNKRNIHIHNDPKPDQADLSNLVSMGSGRFKSQRRKASQSIYEAAGNAVTLLKMKSKGRGIGDNRKAASLLNRLIRKLGADPVSDAVCYLIDETANKLYRDNDTRRILGLIEQATKEGRRSTWNASH
jgi:predicted transcriptional regulator